MSKKKRKTSFKGKTGKDAQRQKQQASSFGYLNLPKGVSMFQPEVGRVRFDILPYEVSDPNHPDRDEKEGIAVEGSLWYKRPFKIHRNIGATNDTLVCPTSIGKRCPICEYRAKGYKEGADPEEMKALRASLRNLYVVYPVKSKKYEEKPHIFDISQHLFQNLLNEELEEDSDYEGFPELEEGFTLKVRFDEESIGKNKFVEAKRIDFEEREEGYDEDVLEEVPNLDECLKIFSYKELETIFFELDEDAVDDEKDEIAGDDEEEKPPKKKRKSKKAEPEPDDEGEENEAEEDGDNSDEDEEEKKPTKRSRSKSKKADPEPDDDSDEDEEEKQPAKRSRKKKESKDKNKCPHGYEFGKDTDEYEECADCEKWDDCIEEKES